MNQVGPDQYGRSVMQQINEDGTAVYFVYTDLSDSVLVFTIEKPTADVASALDTINSMAP
jgi:hypothetical protein